MQGGRRAQRGEAYLARAEALARELGDPYLQATVEIWRAYGHLFVGRWRVMIEHADRALATLEARCTGVRWERVGAANLALIGLSALGEVGEVERRADRHLRDAIDRGDLYAQVVFTQYVALSRIARGDIEGARREARWALEHWIQDEYTAQHVFSLHLEAYCDQHEGRPEAAFARLEAEWPRIRRSRVLHAPKLRVDVLLLAARIRLAMAEQRGGGRLLRACEDIARRLERDPARLDGPPHAALIRAGVAACRGERGRALAFLDRSVASFEALDLRMYAACARRRRGELSGDAAEVAAADAWLRSRGVVDPERWVSVAAPGFGAAEQGRRAA